MINADSLRTVPTGAELGLVVRPITSAAAPVVVKQVQPSISTRSSVNDNAADVLILASNASRLGGGVANDSTAVLYLALGTVAASLTNYTAQVAPGAFYSLGDYTGEVRGIWITDPNTGAARVSELT